MKNQWPQKLYTAEQVHILDELIINQQGISSSVLMARAAEALWQKLGVLWPEVRRLVIVTGLGNNAGDGFVLAHLASSFGLEVTVLLTATPELFSEEALAAFQALEGTRVSIQNFDAALLQKADVIVDAIFGVGLKRSLNGIFLDAVDEINQSQKPVLAVDIPSGLHADTGQPWPRAVRARATVSFIGLKIGLFTGEGRTHAGKIFFDSLKVNFKNLPEIKPTVLRVDESILHFEPRCQHSHKGRHGHVLIIGGDVGMSGAVVLAGKAALRAGAGLVSILTRQEHASFINSSCPELMVHGLESSEDFLRLEKRADVIVIGPGLGRSMWAQEIFLKVIQDERPLVVDADGLYFLSQFPCARKNMILTPHQGEAAQLLGATALRVGEDRLLALRELVKSYLGVVVLKGSGTLISTLGEKVYLCSAGGPALATAGTGDVLTGAIAALKAQGLSYFDAAVFGVCAHAHAGDLAAQDGERGTIASDVIEKLRLVLNSESVASRS